jgi:hypothetical protein
MFSTLDLVFGSASGLLIFGLFAFYFKNTRHSSIYQWAILVEIGGLVAYNIYVGVFGLSDTFIYVEHGQELAEAIRNIAHGDYSYLTDTPFWSPIGSQTYRMYSLVGFLLFLSGGSYLMANVLLAAFGFLGHVLLCKAATQDIAQPRTRRWLEAGILLLPSFNFWSGALLKDVIGIAGLGFSFFYWEQIQRGSLNVRTLLGLLAGYYLLFLFRIQVLPAFIIASLLSLVVGFKSGQQHFEKKALITMIVVPLLALGCTIGYNLYVEQTGMHVTVLIERMQEMAQWYSDNGYDQVGTVLRGAGWTALIAAAPFAVMNVLFRPFPWDVRNLPMALSALENTALIVLTIRGVAKGRASFFRAQWHRHERMGTFAIVFVLVMAVIIGASTINLGSVSRYRIPLLPFFMYILVLSATERGTRPHLEPRYPRWRRPPLPSKPPRS